MIKGYKRKALFLCCVVLLMVVSASDARYGDTSKWGTKSGDFSADKDMDNADFENKEGLRNQGFDDTSGKFEGDDKADTSGFRSISMNTRKKFAIQVRTENKKILKKKLDELSVLDEREKRNLVDCFDKYQAGRASLADGEEPESVEMFVRIAKDDSQNLRQKTDSIREYFKDDGEPRS
ncbi:MAG: hypothetical protein JW938_08060 [Candidatus Omnitrophica bacterium]|nr:hypothetical protein [Candidatus Omnitrophota bacterium]